MTVIMICVTLLTFTNSAFSKKVAVPAVAGAAVVVAAGESGEARESAENEEVIIRVALDVRNPASFPENGLQNSNKTKSKLRSELLLRIPKL